MMYTEDTKIDLPEKLFQRLLTHQVNNFLKHCCATKTQDFHTLELYKLVVSPWYLTSLPILYRLGFDEG